MTKFRFLFICLFVVGLVALAGCKAGRTDKSDRFIRSADDIDGHTIAVILGTAQEKYAEEHFTKSKILSFNSFADSVDAILAGRADLTLISEELAADLLKTKPELAALSVPVYQYHAGIALRKGNTSLLHEWNRFLKQIRDDGTFETMSQRWSSSADSSQQFIPPLENLEDQGTIVVGTDFTLGRPRAYYDAQQRPIGLEYELSVRFAAHLGKKLQVKDISGGGMIQALQAGKIDCAVTGLIITEERLKQVDFSDPYFDDSMLAVARKELIEILPGSETEKNTAETVSVFQRAKTWFVNAVESNLIRENRYLLILEGLWTTLLISIGAMILGTGIGACFCMMLLSRRVFLRGAAKTYIALMWGTPSLVILMIFYYVFFASVSIDPVSVAILAFGMNIGANLANIMCAGVKSVDPCQIEAGRAMGMTAFQAFRWITFPQATSIALPMYQSAFTTLLRGTSVVGYIAIRDLTKSGDLIRSRTFDATFPLLIVAILYLLLSFLISLFFSYLWSRKRKFATSGTSD